MTRFLVGNVFLLLSMVCAASSQILTKALLNEISAVEPNWAAIRVFLTPNRVLHGAAAGGLLVVGFLCWLVSLTRLELSYAYPIACSSLLIVAFLSAAFLGEALTPRMWLGTVLILVGIALLTPSR